MDTADSQEPIKIGQGRSGIVFRVPAPPANTTSDNASVADQDAASGDGASSSWASDGDLAIKVFVGQKTATIVNYILLGAPNPYAWNEHAIACALLRRQILTDLVDYWFGDRLSVANAVASGWNEKHLAYELHTEFINGMQAGLNHPFSKPHEGQLTDLLQNVMKPLQEHLLEAGFDGLLWQAGKGHPVAAANFLRIPEAESESASESQWVWIDLESGVPALFPLNPWALLRFYIPKAFKHGRPMYDDVDTSRLQRYLDDQTEDLESYLDSDRLALLKQRAEELEEHQRSWKKMPRTMRSITYHLKKQRITEEQADYYAKRTLVWNARIALLGMRAGVKQAWRLCKRIGRWLPGLLGNLMLLATSQKYRDTASRKYVERRIDQWEDRRQLTHSQSSFLRTQLNSEETSAYLADFAVHMAVKPFAKVTQYAIIFPLTFWWPVINLVLGLFLIFTLGMLVRTAYSAFRVAFAFANGREKPWVALVIGTLPWVGNLAYPIQIIYSGSDRDAKLAKFIVYDSLTRAGQQLPIWGGPDTQTEHAFNRLGNLFVWNRQPLEAPNAPDSSDGDTPSDPEPDSQQSSAATA